MTYIEQEEEAKRLICKYGKNWMLYDNEAIGEIISTCCKARHMYNPEIGALSTYLITSVQNTIAKLSKDKYKSYKTCEIVMEPKFRNTNELKMELMDMINSNVKLTDNERKYIIRHYLENHSIKDIANESNCSKQNIDQHIRSGLSKIKKEYLNV